MELDINLLEKIVLRMFIDLKKQGIVSLDFDYYWEVPGKYIYNTYNEPKVLEIGQLSEDYKFLYTAYKNEYLVQHNFKKVASLLRYLAEKALHNID